MVKAQAGILETDPPAAAEEKLRTAGWPRWTSARVAARGPPPPAGRPRRRGRAGGRSAERRSRRGGGSSRRSPTQRPLVLVFEDLHWADDGLLDFVDHLVDWATGVPLLVVVTARPELLERRPGWGGGKRNATTVSLSPLSDDDTARSSQRCSTVASSRRRRSVVLLAATRAAIPLYAEEYARMLAERGRRRRRLPETLQGIIAARLDALPPAEKALLQDAAVRREGVLARCARGDGRRRRPASSRSACTRSSGRSSSGASGARRSRASTEYAFRHVLVRDVAYGQIPRRGEPSCIAWPPSWIESLGRPEDHAEMLAHHYLAGARAGRGCGRRHSGAGRAGAPGTGRRRRPGGGALRVEAARRFYEAALGCARRTILNGRSCSTSEPSPPGRTCSAATASNWRRRATLSSRPATR